MSDLDRQVHAVLPDGTQIVRHDRAGKWYAYPIHGKRTPLTLTAAVTLATPSDVLWREGAPGGQAFDAKVRRSRGE